MKAKKLKGGFTPFVTEDEKLLVTTNSTNMAYVYNLEDEKLQYSLKTLSHVSETAISKDKKYLAAKNTSGTIGVFSLETGEQICKSAMEKREGESIVFVGDSMEILDFDWEGRTMLLDGLSGEYRILEGPESGVKWQEPRTYYMHYDRYSNQIYKFMAHEEDDKQRVIWVCDADINNISYKRIREVEFREVSHTNGISFCKTHNFYAQKIDGQLVMTDKNFCEIKRFDLPDETLSKFDRIWVSSGEKYVFAYMGKQCDPRDYQAYKTAKSLSYLFSLETMEKIAEFDYDFVSDFLTFDDEKKFVIATWKGSYIGTL